MEKPKLKDPFLQKKCEDGGLKMMDIKSLNCSMKLKWLKNLMSQ